jgi:hypothetical protein
MEFKHIGVKNVIQGLEIKERKNMKIYGINMSSTNKHLEN